MAEAGTIAAVIAAITAAACGAAAGVALRKRRLRKAGDVATVVEVDDRRLVWKGPYRDGNGVIHAVSAAEQIAWCTSLGGRLPTAAEFDAIWRSSAIKVPPHTYPGAIGPLTSLNEDALRAGAKPGDTIACGKTWIASPPGVTTNYGFFVPKSETKFDAALGYTVWRGIKAYPSSTMPEDWYVLQAPGTAHNSSHVDYSQAGYCVIDAPAEG